MKVLGFALLCASLAQGFMLPDKMKLTVSDRLSTFLTAYADTNKDGRVDQPELDAVISQAHTMGLVNSGVKLHVQTLGAPASDNATLTQTDLNNTIYNMINQPYRTFMTNFASHMKEEKPVQVKNATKAILGWKHRIKCGEEPVIKFQWRRLVNCLRNRQCSFEDNCPQHLQHQSGQQLVKRGWGKKKEQKPRNEMTRSARRNIFMSTLGLMVVVPVTLLVMGFAFVSFLFLIGAGFLSLVSGGFLSWTMALPGAALGLAAVGFVGLLFVIIALSMSIAQSKNVKQKSHHYARTDMEASWQ